MERHRVLKGYLFAAGGAALFSTKAIFIKLAYMEEANAALMLALRIATALPFFIGVGLYAVCQLRQAGKPLPGWGLTFRALLARRGASELCSRTESEKIPASRPVAFDRSLPGLARPAV